MKQGGFLMQARVSLPVDYTATQFLSRMVLPRDRSEEIVEPEYPAGLPSVSSGYATMIGRGAAIGDSIDIENWRNPTQASATIGALSLAVRVGRLGRSFSNTDFFSAQGWTIAGTFGLEQKPAIEAAISQIEVFQSRRAGWKGPNSFGPTKRTIDDARTFAAVVLADNRIEPPHIGLAADGEITFFWRNPKITIDLTIAGDGTYAYFAKPDAGPPFFQDAALVTRNLPEEIVRLIRHAA
jgi:hypothetical protein